MRNYNWEGKEERAAAAIAHTQKMDSRYKNEIQECVNKSKIYGVDFVGPKVEGQIPHGVIVAMDSVTAAFYFEEGKTAILNFASFKNPGGMFIGGSRAQEECLCHESFLYNVLQQFWDEYYHWNNDHLNRALYYNRAIYSPNVIFEHDLRKSKFDVITCAAPNKKAAQKYQQVSEEENHKVLSDRIRFVLDVAQDNNVDTLILGAYGCGVFGQDATLVARIFKTLLPLYNFKKIIFAIPQGNGNFEKFVEVWKPKKEVEK